MPEMIATPDAAGEIFEKTLFLQPYVYLFNFEYDLFKYRFEFLKHDAEYWLNHDFPELDRSRNFYYVLYRNKKNEISYKEISLGEHFILSLFQKGASIDNICELLEDQEPTLYETAAENLQKWFQEWTARGWLCLPQ
jgi:hypothetical protein